MAEADASSEVDMLKHVNLEDTDDAHIDSTSEVGPIGASTDTANRDVDPDSTIMKVDPVLISPQEDTLFSFSALGEVLHETAVKRSGLAVIVPPAQNRWEYKVFEEDDEVDEILEEYDDAGFVEYLVLFTDGSEDVVSFGSDLPALQHLLLWLPALPSILRLDITTYIISHYPTSEL